MAAALLRVAWIGTLRGGDGPPTSGGAGARTLLIAIDAPLRVVWQGGALAVAVDAAAVLAPTPAWRVHAGGSAAAAQAVVFTIAAGAARRDPFARLPLPLAVAVPDSARWRAELAAMRACAAQAEVSDAEAWALRLRPHADRLLIDWLAVAAATHPPCERPPPAWLREAYRIVCDEASRGIRLVEIARTVGVGLDRLKRGFRAVYGVAPATLLRRVRLEQASRLLHGDPPLSVREVAARCGYSSAEAFAHAFRRLHGHAPRAEPAQVDARRLTP